MRDLVTGIEDYYRGYKRGQEDALEIFRVLLCKYAEGRDIGEIDRLLKEIEEIVDEI